MYVIVFIFQWLTRGTYLFQPVQLTELVIVFKQLATQVAKKLATLYSNCKNDMLFFPPTYKGLKVIHLLSSCATDTNILRASVTKNEPLCEKKLALVYLYFMCIFVLTV